MSSSFSKTREVNLTPSGYKLHKVRESLTNRFLDLYAQWKNMAYFLSNFPVDCMDLRLFFCPKTHYRLFTFQFHSCDYKYWTLRSASIVDIEQYMYNRKHSVIIFHSNEVKVLKKLQEEHSKHVYEITWISSGVYLFVVRFKTTLERTITVVKKLFPNKKHIQTIAKNTKEFQFFSPTCCYARVFGVLKNSSRISILLLQWASFRMFIISMF